MLADRPEIDKLFLSGKYNVFTLKAGKTIDADELDDAFAGKKMSVEKFEKQERPRPAAAFSMKVDAKAIG